jgi:hypothetical protein
LAIRLRDRLTAGEAVGYERPKFGYRPTITTPFFLFLFCYGQVYSEISRYYCPRRLQLFSHDVEPRLKIILENLFDYKVVGAKKINKETQKVNLHIFSEMMEMLCICNGPLLFVGEIKNKVRISLYFSMCFIMTPFGYIQIHLNKFHLLLLHVVCLSLSIFSVASCGQLKYTNQ